MKRAWLALALTAACADPIIPGRQSYGFDDGAGGVFHWPVDLLPVRYYIDDRGPMRSLVSEGLAAWTNQFLYGEWRAAFEPDSNAAAVIVRWGSTVPPDVPPDPGAPVFACAGVTQIAIDSVTAAVERPMRITVTPLGGTFTPEQLVACYARVLSHEIGHSLGLLQHSPDPSDLMASQPTVRAPSTRDRMTVEVLYHTAPTIGAPR